MAHGETYEEFVDKFKPKKTTDDCYTPPAVYEVVAGYVSERYGIDRADMVRPFWPCGDFEGFDYPEGCCVVDNPPFSILARIKRFYLDRGIDFFLFVPLLTAFGGAWDERVCIVAVDGRIEYANGAKVRTSFATTLEPGVAARTDSALEVAIADACRDPDKAMPRYEYPPELVRACDFARLGHWGADFAVSHADCAKVLALDSQRDAGKGIFGSGLLLSERAAAERAAAERARVDPEFVWELSPRELAIVESLGA